MAAHKNVAHGTVFNISSSPLQLVVSITPPARTRQEIEATLLGDTLEVPVLGIEQKSEMVANVCYDKRASNHVALVTAFDAKTELTVQIVTAHTEPVTDEFTAQITKIEEDEMAPGSVYKAKITFVRTGAITSTQSSEASST